MDGPLFILGAPRSGTSLLYRVLCLHPAAAWVSGWNARATTLPEVAVLHRLGRGAPALRRRIWFGEEGDELYPHRTALGRVARRFPQPVEGERVFRRRRALPGHGATAPDRSQERLRRDVERIVRASGGRVLVSKATAHNRRVSLLDSLFPESRFVVVCRDGRDVAHSLTEAASWPREQPWWWMGTPTEWAAARDDVVALAARHWVEEVTAIEDGVAGLPRSRVLRVTYEAMVRSPLDVLSGVAVFSGLGTDPGWEEELAELRFPHFSRLTPRTTHEPRVDEIQADTLRDLGYPA
ncbi:sulfotransferase family protein [Nocardioides sp. GCM10027113]|uniref:sulfotransferase family protein n=1 Tax=unclassified Nocardioides TaxID=2615069 RepID=UPI00362061B5